MDAPRVILSLLALCALTAAAQDTSVEASTPAVEVTTVENNATEAATPEPRNCTTSRNDSGTCVVRTDCDYSTPAIDLTLYVPHWYKIPCMPEEVCCPFDALVLVDSESEDNNNSTTPWGNDDDSDDDFK